MLNSFASKSVQEKYNLSSYARISISQYYDLKDSKEKTISDESIKLQGDNDGVEHIATDSVDGSSTKVESKTFITREEDLSKTCEKVDSKINSLTLSNKESLIVDENEEKTNILDRVSIK